MLKVQDILEAGVLVAQALWPGGTVYINTVPVNFVRPPCLVEVDSMTLEPSGRREGERTANLRVTRFQKVDDYHNTQVELLAEELTLMLAKFSGPSIPVEDRWLRVGKCTGRYENDYAELTVPLSWVDDLDTAAVEQALMEQYTLAVDAGGKE